MILSNALALIWKKTDRSRHCLLTGQGGCGKSTMVKKLMSDLLSRQDGPTPIYINLADIYEGKSIIGQLLFDYCGQSSGNDDLSTRRESLLHLFSTSITNESAPKFLLILDGLDDAVGISRFDGELSELASCRNLQIVVTVRSRDYITVNSLPSISDFRELAVNCLSKDKVFSILQQNDIPINVLSSNLLEQLRIPMYMSLFLSIASDSTEKSSSINKVSDLFDLYLNRENKRLSTRSPDNAGTISFALYYIMPYLAFLFDNMSFPYELLIEKLSHAYLSLRSRDPNFAGIIINEGDLFRRFVSEVLVPGGFIQESGNTYRFSHREWKDYFRLYFLNVIENRLSFLYKGCLLNTNESEYSSFANNPHDAPSDVEAVTADYATLRKIGYTPLSIAESLVENDLKLYGSVFQKKGITAQNEGSALQWAEFLSSYPMSFQYMINRKNEIVGNFSFVSITDDLLKKYLDGEIFENSFVPSTMRDLFSSGNDHILFLLNFSINDEYSTPENNTLLRKLFLKQLLSFAQEDGIFFKKIVTNVYKSSHEAFFKQWGFSLVKQSSLSGNIYELIMTPYPSMLYNHLKRNKNLADLNEKLKTSYDQEYSSMSTTAHGL